MKHVADLLKRLEFEALQEYIGLAIAMIGLAFTFVLVCFGIAILKLSGVSYNEHSSYFPSSPSSML